MNDVLDAFLQPLEQEPPTGPNLEYEPEFQALEEAARPRQERANGSGVIAPEEPDWREVDALARPLLQRSRDLRIAVHLTNAQLDLQGIPGWADGLHLISTMLRTFWDEAHPRLDAEEDNDPTERINAIAPLGSTSIMLNRLRNTPLFKGALAGSFSLRELRIAQGVIKLEDNADRDGLPDLALINACVQEIPLPDLNVAHAALARALEDVTSIEAAFAEHTPGQGPELDALQRDLRDLLHFLSPTVEQRQAAEDATTADTGETESSGPAATNGGDIKPAAASTSGLIERPEDVSRALNQICQYYARHEPSSPVPVLLRRAQRLIGKDFDALLRELAPGGMAEFSVLSGQHGQGEYQEQGGDE